jgi:hypothetical protein
MSLTSICGTEPLMPKFEPEKLSIPSRYKYQNHSSILGAVCTPSRALTRHPAPITTPRRAVRCPAERRNAAFALSKILVVVLGRYALCWGRMRWPSLRDDPHRRPSAGRGRLLHVAISVARRMVLGLVR